jgi:hypothetical protein
MVRLKMPTRWRSCGLSICLRLKQLHPSGPRQALSYLAPQRSKPSVTAPAPQPLKSKPPHRCPKLARMTVPRLRPFSEACKAARATMAPCAALRSCEKLSAIAPPRHLRGHAIHVQRNSLRWHPSRERWLGGAGAVSECTGCPVNIVDAAQKIAVRIDEHEHP